MALTSTTLRPGLLVSLSTSLNGNVRYAKTTLEANTETADGAAIARWETQRTIYDPAEHEAGCKARQKAGALIRAVCAHSAFGLLCPEADADKLEAAIAAARAVAVDFNDTARLSRVTVYVITGRIAPDDVEAVRAINSEIRGLLDTMQAGVKNLDVKVIREAANRAKSVGEMLSPEAQERVRVAVETAREVARKIVKAGEAAAVEVDVQAARKIAEARTAFLDLTDVVEIAAPVAQTRTLDVTPEEDESQKSAEVTERDPPIECAPAVFVPAIEL